MVPMRRMWQPSDAGAIPKGYSPSLCLFDRSKRADLRMRHLSWLSLRQPFGLVLPGEAFEERSVPLLVAQDVYHHVLRDVIGPLGLLDDLGVVLDKGARCAWT